MKETRIRGLIPRWESKSIFLVGDNFELLDEMRTFPNGQYDDVLDSLSMQLPHARAPYRKPMHLRDEEKETNIAI
jgi:phage terminase large subunit-like protein